MKISVLCPKHPIWSRLLEWRNNSPHEVDLVHQKEDLTDGDILFLISCNEIIKSEYLDCFTHSLVIHASDLPNGRGWSPHIWQILKGRKEICVSLIDAREPVDSGDIWEQDILKLEGHELYDEINDLLFKIELSLMDYAVDNYKTIIPLVQRKGGSHYSKRTPADSEIDIDKSIAEQFDLLRVSDPDRYPAFFKLHGFTYEISIKKH